MQYWFRRIAAIERDEMRKVGLVTERSINSRDVYHFRCLHKGRINKQQFGFADARKIRLASVTCAIISL